MDTKPDVIDQSRVTEGILFATHRDRGLYIGTLLRNRRQWLKDHPDAWRRVQEVEQEAALLRRCLETPVEATAAGPSPHMSSPDVRNDGKDAGDAGSVEIPAGDPSPAQQLQLATILPVTDAAPSAPGDEIAIGTRRYVSAKRFATMLGISRRTLSRRCPAGKGRPTIKIGNQIYFELGTILGWLASDGSHQEPPTNNEAC